MAVPKGYIPNQHGAWAMLVVPFLFGIMASGPSWIHVPLFLAWLLVYLTMFPLLLWVRTGRREIYRKPVLFYATILILPAASVLVMKPELLWVAPLFLPLFAVNAYYASRNRERALLNDAAAVVQFSLIIFVGFTAGEGTDWRIAWELFAVSVLYFMSTVFYVKTMIRERGNRTFYFFSAAVHIIVLAAAGLGLHAGLTVPFGILLGRAIAFPKRGLTVKQSGILEIVFAVVVTTCVWILYSS